MNSSDFLTILAAVAVPLVATLAGLGTYFGSRRAASGKVETTEAAILWQQSQDMRAMLLAEKERAEEQRDRLIAGYTEQVLPMLTVINASLQTIQAGVARMLEGGDRGEVVAMGKEPDSGAR